MHLHRAIEHAGLQAPRQHLDGRDVDARGARTFAVDALGFHITATVLLLAWARFLRASLGLALSIAVGATVVIHLSFYKLLKVPLPWGVFERFAF